MIIYKTVIITLDILMMVGLALGIWQADKGGRITLGLFEILMALSIVGMML